MEQTVRQLQGDIPLEQQIIRNKIRSADKIQDHFSEQILERTQRVIFNIEIGGKLPEKKESALSYLQGKADEALQRSVRLPVGQYRTFC